MCFPRRLVVKGAAGSHRRSHGNMRGKVAWAATLRCSIQRDAPQNTEQGKPPRAAALASLAAVAGINVGSWARSIAAPVTPQATELITSQRETCHELQRFRNSAVYFCAKQTKKLSSTHVIGNGIRAAKSLRVKGSYGGPGIQELLYGCVSEEDGDETRDTAVCRLPRRCLPLPFPMERLDELLLLCGHHRRIRDRLARGSPSLPCVAGRWGLRDARKCSGSSTCRVQQPLVQELEQLLVPSRLCFVVQVSLRNHTVPAGGSTRARGEACSRHGTRG